MIDSIASISKLTIKSTPNIDLEYQSANKSVRLPFRKLRKFLNQGDHDAFSRRRMQHSKVSASAGGMSRQRCCHGCSRAVIRRPGTEAEMRIRRAPSRNPGDCLHVPTEQQLLFNGEIPRRKVAREMSSSPRMLLGMCET